MYPQNWCTILHKYLNKYHNNYFNNLTTLTRYTYKHTLTSIFYKNLISAHTLWSSVGKLQSYISKLITTGIMQTLLSNDRHKIFTANKAVRSVRPLFERTIPRASSADLILRQAGILTEWVECSKSISGDTNFIPCARALISPPGN